MKNIQENYLASAKKQFAYYQMLGDRTFAQLSEEELFWRLNAESNNIGVIVNHLHGNMLSRWTDFLTSDGEKTWRNRDSEFEEMIKTKAQLLQKWKKGWDCLFAALDTLHKDNMDTEIYIRNQGHSIVEAVNRQMSHYAYHVGQIVFIGRMIKGSEWQSLSIPKGASKAYNAAKFAQEKHQAHFTDEYLDKK